MASKMAPSDRKALHNLCFPSLDRLLTLNASRHSCTMAVQHPCQLKKQEPSHVCEHPVDKFRITDNSRRHIFCWLLAKLMLGIHTPVDNEELMKVFWKIFESTCPNGHRGRNRHYLRTDGRVCVNPFHFRLDHQEAANHNVVFHGEFSERELQFSELPAWKLSMEQTGATQRFVFTRQGDAAEPQTPPAAFARVGLESDRDSAFSPLPASVKTATPVKRRLSLETDSDDSGDRTEEAHDFDNTSTSSLDEDDFQRKRSPAKAAPSVGVFLMNASSRSAMLTHQRKHQGAFTAPAEMATSTDSGRTELDRDAAAALISFARSGTPPQSPPAASAWRPAPQTTPAAFATPAPFAPAARPASAFSRPHSPATAPLSHTAQLRDVARAGALVGMPGVFLSPQQVVLQEIHRYNQAIQATFLESSPLLIDPASGQAQLMEAVLRMGPLLPVDARVPTPPAVDPQAVLAPAPTSFAFGFGQGEQLRVR
eukprot:m.395342 g.395342  ORF g.395342 m.395342 type:complete len:482 (-) comp56391_c0_seq1:177-1622(-)